MAVLLELPWILAAGGVGFMWISRKLYLRSNVLESSTDVVWDYPTSAAQDTHFDRVDQTTDDEAARCPFGRGICPAGALLTSVQPGLCTHPDSPPISPLHTEPALSVFRCLFLQLQPRDGSGFACNGITELQAAHRAGDLLAMLAVATRHNAALPPISNEVVAACERSLAAKEARLKQIEALPAWRWGISAAEQSALRESIKIYLERLFAFEADAHMKQL
ncbi:hypothetical protein WJX75_008472 [Coccomyxa subellipsoidea]|uniref:Uncharacterized protein n=1 Tax=Coccomyxa subellipsoidea TaxID=248742 RepID=A0ABR2YD84_9CHLO